MARIYGLNGALRGRQGNNVFAVQNGTQVVKAYQPVVYNPRTMPQREQRAKFALAGKLSGASPREAMLGLLGESSRSRRARFVSSIVRAASASGTIDNIVASVPFASIQWSEGALSRYSSSFSATAVYDQHNIICTVPAMTFYTTVPEGYGEMVVVGLFDADSRPLDEIQVGIRSTTTQLTFSFRETPTRVAASVAMWLCPFVSSHDLTTGRSSSLYPTEAGVNVNVLASAVASARSWGASQYVTVIQVAPATTSMVPGPDDEARTGSEHSSVKSKK